MSPWLSDLLLRTQTDERLAALARLGHQRAFETIVERYKLPLSAYAQRISPNRAEDLVQQTFLAALSALQDGTEVRHLRGWLYEIMRNLAWRETGRWPAMAELDDSAPATESAETVAERRMLALDALTEVSQLPDRQHEALIQTAIQGRSRVEVAASMGISEGAVRQLVHRARATVRSAVTAITPFPLIRWLAGTPGGGSGLPEAALGAGTAASGAGIALKLGVGALVASGVLATGVTVSLIHGNDRHGPSARTARARTDSDLAGRAVAGRAGSTARTILASQNGLPGGASRTHSSTRTSAGRAHSSGQHPGTSSSQPRGQSGGQSGGQFGGGRGGQGTPTSPGRGTDSGDGSGSGNGGGDQGDGSGSGSGSGTTGSHGVGGGGGGGGSDDGSSGSGTSGSQGGGSGGTQGGGSGSTAADDGSSNDDSSSQGGSSGSSGSGISGSGSSGSGSSGSGSSGSGSSGSGSSGSDGSDGGSSGSGGSGGE